MKTKITLIVVALLAICAYAANSWKATEDTPTAAGTTLVDDELLTATTVYETTLKSSAISFADQDFTHYIQVRVSALPTADNVYGTAQDGSTPISLTVKKNIKLTIYYRRQSTEQTETGGVFAAEDGKDIKCFNQADGSQISGELTVIQQTEDFKYGYATKVYELAEGNSYTLAARGTTIQFFGITYETTEPAIPEMGEAIELDLYSGKDIAAEVATAMAENPYPASITINLGPGSNYTCNNSIVVNCPLTIGLNPLVDPVPGQDWDPIIDASALEGPMVLISKDIHPDFMNESEAYNLGSFSFNHLNITGLKRQFFFANEMKVLLSELIVNDCIIGIDGTAKKTIFDFARGGNTAQLTVENSTIYAIPSNAQNGGFFSAQSSQDVPQLGGTTKTTSIKNSTLYGIATEKTTSTPRRNNNDYITYEVKNSIIVDCGKKAQFLKGLNGGQPGNNCVWDIDGNSFQWTEIIDEVPTLTDICADEICGADSALVKNNVEGVVVFANDVTTGDFTLGDCPQNDAKIGDPRWHVDIIPTMGEDIILNLESGKDIYNELATAMVGNKYPGSITINLAADGAYTVSQTLEVNCPLTIVGNAEQPATIDASALETPFVLLSKEIHPSFYYDENSVYDMGSFYFENIKVTGVKRQFFFANEMKALVTELAVTNCVIGIDGTAKKTIFDFAKGGNTARLDIENSTIYAIPSNAQNGGFFSAQSSQDVPSLGGTTKTTIIKNSTLYGIATGKTTSTPRRNNNDYITYEVKNSIIVDCGKKAQFLKGLNGGQPGNSCVWDVDGNSFQWTEVIDEVPTLTDISADEICGADSSLVKNNVEGVVVFANDVATGDFTLGDCPQNEAKIGDPRWLVEIIPPLGDDIVLDLYESGKDIAAEVAAAMENNKYPKSVTINLNGGAYIWNSSLVINCPLTINGLLPINSQPYSTIDASALDEPMILVSKDLHPGFLNESEAYVLGSFKFEDIYVTGLKKQFFFANEMKVLITELSMNDCVIGIDGTAKKTIFDFAKGGNTTLLALTNSTIYAIPSNAQNGGFFSAQSSQDVPQLGGTTKTTSIKNSTLYGIATGKTTSTPRRNNNDYITYEVKNSIIVDCGKRGQFLKGLNGGQPGNNCTWDIDGNAFQWTETADEVSSIIDISSEETCGGEVKNNVEGNLVFDNDPTTGNFKLGDCPQNDAKIGDPRWININVGINDIRVNNNDGLWYNLQGTKVSHPTKGIYIHNGKKVVIK